MNINKDKAERHSLGSFGMHKQMGKNACVLIVLLLLLTLLAGCGRPSPSAVQPGEQLPSSTTMSEAPVVYAEPSSTRVEIYSFHLPFRCAECICYEERCTYVVNEYFQDDLKNGTLIYRVIEIGNLKDAPIVNKYNAFGAQIFINTVVDETDSIRNLKEIVFWNCGHDEAGFNAKLRNVIAESLLKVKQ